MRYAPNSIHDWASITITVSDIRAEWENDMKISHYYN